MNKEEKEITLKDIHNDLVELLKWTKFAGIKEVKSVLESSVITDEEKIIYSLSDGRNSSYNIAKTMGSNDTVRRKISNYWDMWENVGLGSSMPAQGGTRFKHSFSLDDFGIKVPEIPQQAEQPAPESKQTENQSTTEVESDV